MMFLGVKDNFVFMSHFKNVLYEKSHRDFQVARIICVRFVKPMRVRRVNASETRKLNPKLEFLSIEHATQSYKCSSWFCVTQ